MRVAILTGGFDRPYAFGLAMALLSKNVFVDMVGSDEVDSPEMHSTPNLQFLNLWNNQRKGETKAGKVARLLAYYARLLRYAAGNSPAVLHILWNNKFQVFDRTFLMLYYKALGKKVAITAHNVNQGKRDGNDTLLNRLTLTVQYRLADHIFVHTRKMKDELGADFGVKETNVTVIRHPINNAFPDTNLTPAEAKQRLGIAETEKAILFFGRITPYKGIEYLLTAFRQLASKSGQYRLIIAGQPKKGNEEYLEQIEAAIGSESGRGGVIVRSQFIPDSDIELYLKAADVMVLPYKDIFQSGVLFLGYSYGLPVIATDVGSFREEIVEGETGFICKPADPDDLAGTIERYFESDLYRNLKTRRLELREYAQVHHSWSAVGELTRNAYIRLSEN